MRLRSVQLRIRPLAVGAAFTTILLGGSILFLRDFAPIRNSAPRGPSHGSVIMEGVDINSNGRCVVARPGSVQQHPHPLLACFRHSMLRLRVPDTAALALRAAGSGVLSRRRSAIGSQ